jgi:hypothetical protein
MLPNYRVYAIFVDFFPSWEFSKIFLILKNFQSLPLTLNTTATLSTLFVDFLSLFTFSQHNTRFCTHNKHKKISFFFCTAIFRQEKEKWKWKTRKIFSNWLLQSTFVFTAIETHFCDFSSVNGKNSGNFFFIERKFENF